MEKKWTPAQRAAIDTRDRTLLVSAAAGSGKTATLTERIIRSLTDPESPASIEDMLIVTYTRAAASELRSRIFKALSDALANNPSNRHLGEQLMKLGSARICTIDSFYLELVRSNFSRLGLSPSFRVADTEEIEVLSQALMNETIHHFYENDPEFPLFAECFCGIRSHDALIPVLLKLDSDCASFPEGISFIKSSAEQTEAEADCDFFATRFGSVIRKNVADFARHLCDVFSHAVEHILSVEEYQRVYLPTFSYMLTFSKSLLEIMEKSDCAYAEAQELLNSYDMPGIAGRLKKGVATTDDLAFYKKLRTNLDKKILALRDHTFAKSPAVIARTMHDTAHHAFKIYEVLTDYEARMAKEKKERNFLHFSDIHHQTLRLLLNEDGTPTDIARTYAQTFSHIYIDEYQDVDRVQDTIFRAISRPDNRFMVGDIKQSIYSFRGAEPRVFAEYREAFPPYGACPTSTSETIFMSNNFRCDQTVIDFTNAVCSYLFRFCADSIGYCSEDDLVFSKSLPSENYCAPPVQVSVILPPEKESTKSTDEEAVDIEEEGYNKLKAEGEYIAEEIARLIRHEKKADGTPILPGDIAILSRSRKIHPYVADALKARGIASSSSGKDRYFEDPDVLMMLCLLNSIDNPHRDIPMAGALRSPIFGFSLDDLVRLRHAANPALSLYDAVLLGTKLETPLGERCRLFTQTLDAWRDRAASLPVDRLLQEIFDSELFLASGLCTQPDDGRGGNLLLLYDYARSFVGSSFKGLYEFIEFINIMMEDGRKLETPPVSVTPDCVSMMTVHQSKGLEFPVCFVCATGGEFNKPEERESLLFDYPLGIAMKLADGTGFGRINTPMREAILKNCSQKSAEEEMRILYVALTRARERLYVTGTASNQENLLTTAESGAKIPSRYVLLQRKSYLEWIMTALCASKDKALPYNLSFICASDLNVSTCEMEDKTADDTPLSILPDEALLSSLREQYAFSYPYADLYRIPAKLSVSRLSPDVLDEADTAVDLVSSKLDKTPDFFKTGQIAKHTAAERGTATHLFLQFCDFSYAAHHGVRKEFDRLNEKKFLPPDADKLIQFSELERFFAHPLLDEILSARRVIREQRFNISLSPEGFTQDAEFLEKIRGEHLAVQGVIDLILEDENGRLCLYDYKTDRLSAEELADPTLATAHMNDRHGLQLSYYARAAEELFGRPCDRIAIYSTHAAELFDIVPRRLVVPEKK